MAQSEKQIALLKNKLQMPLVIRDLLITNQKPSADATYALHEMMSNFQPEEAVLCAAFTMKEIAAHDAFTSTDLAFLNMECDRIIERYSARDDLAEDNPDLWLESQGEMMYCIAEDIDDFLELIFLCYMSFEVTSPEITALLDIITTQLQSHSMIVDEVISLQEEMRRGANAGGSTQSSRRRADNVIIFPRQSSTTH